MRGPSPDTESSYNQKTLVYTQLHVVDIKQHAHCKMGAIKKFLVALIILFEESAESFLLALGA